MMKILQLKPGREKALLRQHPWIFSGAVHKVLGDPVAGETVTVQDNHGRELGQAAYSPASQIRARMWSWDPDEAVGADFFRQRLEQALALRAGLPERDVTDAWRLVHGESDGLPGVVVDRYSEVLSVQFLSAGAEYWRQTLLELLIESCRPVTVYERSDADVRELEGLTPQTGLLWGRELDEPVLIQEHGLRYAVDVAGGHKTGYYLDQRDNRMVVRRLAGGRRVLDCFCYSGGFSLNALRGGAVEVLGVDSSAAALEAASEHTRLNGLDLDRISFKQGDVFAVLREMRDRNLEFDLVVLDPPKFAPTASQAKRAARGYKDINLLAIKLLAPGGTLVTFSCSGGVDRLLFQKIVAGAALDSGRQVRITHWLSQGGDHPVGLNFPEGEYLKGLVLQVD